MVPGQIFFAVVTVLTATAWGLLSLWAATSKQHLGVRLLAVALPLGLFLNVPAYEPAIFFAIQTLVVVGGILIARHRRHEDTGFRFSLQSLLVATLVASFLLACAARSSVTSWWTWCSLVTGSVALGIATLMAAWETQLWKKLFLLPIALTIAALPVGLCDGMLLGFPEWDRAIVGPMLGGGAAAGRSLTPAATMLWFGVLLSTWLLLSGVLTCWSFAKTDVGWKKWSGRIGALTLLVLVITPLAWIYAYIPAPTPTRPAIEGKNGFDVMNAARERFAMMNAIDYPEQATNAELAAAMKKNSEAIELFREMADLPFQPPPGWNMMDVQNDAGFLRYIARTFIAHSNLARREGRLDDVLDNAEDLNRIAHRMETSNMLMVLVGIAVEGMAHQSLSQVRGEFNTEQAGRAIKVLSEIDAATSTYADIREVENAWAQRNWGWRKQLYDAFAPVTGIDDMAAMLVASRSAMSRSAVVRRLLLLDFAIRNYERERGSLPKSLDDLGLDASLLVDAYSADRSQIHYEVTGNSYKLYSIGPDGVDDGGQPIGDELWHGEGDLLLDSLFPARPIRAPQPTDANSA